MGIFETLFDLTYLILVMGLGLSLMVETEINAKIFGLMGIVLGLGDGFHLLPRIISHLSYKGVEGYVAILSWGQMVTSITMTIFYLLFYLYYRRISGDNSVSKRNFIFILTFLRIAITLLPQNNWGSAQASYSFGIYRNIPFTIMGIALIMWFYKKRDLAGLKNMWLLISLSFIFYLPVVLLVNKYPMVGALMMPKTLAYLFLIISGVRTLRPYFGSKDILALSLSSLILGLGGGVFYREFTKFNEFTGFSHLSKIHPHILVLGFIFSLILYLFTRDFSLENLEKLGKELKIYLTGLVLTISSMVAIGIWEVVGSGKIGVGIKALEGISGMGHLFIGIGIVRIIFLLIKNEREKDDMKKTEYSIA